MVSIHFWDIQLDAAIKTTRRRIVLAEKHGIGKMAIQEKIILAKQEKARLDRR